MKLYNSSLLLVYLFLIIGCTSTKKETPDETVQQLLPDAPAEVTAITLKTTDFEHELVSNGKVSARTVAELKFQASETIAQIFVKNGSHVSQGERIAVLDNMSRNISLAHELPVKLTLSMFPN